MTNSLGAGSAIILAAGVLQGIYAVPMKLAKRWQYENTWLVFTAIALVIFPWALTLATVPHLAAVYRTTSASTLCAIAGFGLCWGIGVTLIGLGLNMLGIGLGFAVILGISASVGSLIPLLVLEPGKLATHQGHVYLLGTLIMLLGVGLGARAGILRDRSPDDALSGASVKKGSSARGLLVVTVAGLLCSALNFCYAFGDPVRLAAEHQGASSLWSSNAITALATTGGFLANLLYCGYLLWRNRSASLFWGQGLRINWVLCALMAVSWFGGQAMYGLGSAKLGTMGTVFGWLLLMGMIIISSGVAGYLSGEWKGAPAPSRTYLSLSMMLILIALAVLALAHGG